MRSLSFDRFAGAAAIAVGVAGFVYAISFVVLVSEDSDAADVVGDTILLFGGVLSTAVLVALYGRLRDVDPPFALWALVLGVAGGLVSSIHGGYDVANELEDPLILPDAANPADPRGLATFGFTALAVAVLSWLILRSGRLPRRLGYLGFAAAVLLLIVYLGRLIIVDPDHPVLLAAAGLVGFLVNPLWYVWVGLLLWRGYDVGTPRRTAA